ncbi:MAG TPA: NADH-quinone oxidoreductase subunit C [Microthrixaceae bacterium]|nr:NADH-quinone oxidoreductase subunit C [Microthrixaceae bacterium]
MAEAPESAVDADTPADEVAPVPAERLHGALVVRVGDEVVLHAERSDLVPLVTKLRADGFWQCIDLFGVDYLTHPGRSHLPAEVTPERFEVVVSLLNHNESRRVRIRVQVPEDDPTVPTLFKLHPGTEAMEREAYDLFGIVFTDHPDMTRILLPDEWSGHPLRKDYSVGRIPVQFKQGSTER